MSVGVAAGGDAVFQQKNGAAAYEARETLDTSIRMSTWYVVRTWYLVCAVLVQVVSYARLFVCVGVLLVLVEKLV